MNKKSFRPRFINILTVFVFCLLLNAPIQAQKNNNSEKSLADLYEDFKTAKRLPCGQRDEAIRILKLIIEKYDGELDGDFRVFIKIRFLELQVEEDKCKGTKTATPLAKLFMEFKEAANAPCGQRDKAIQIGKEIYYKFGNKDVAYYVRDKVEKIEAEDKKCKTDNSKDSLKALYENFKATQLMTCGKRDEAIRIGKQIIEKFGGNEQSKFVVEWVKRRILVIESDDKKCRSIDSLETLFGEFRQLAKLPCGERDEPISFGKFIIEKFGDDELNKEVIDYIKKRVAFLEKDEKTCVTQGDFYEPQKKL